MHQSCVTRTCAEARGFTLVELMIVVAIVGILTALAVPMYQDYSARAQMSEAFALASGLKTPVAEVIAHQGVASANSGFSGLPLAADVSGRLVATVAVVNGAITATMRNDAVVVERIRGGSLTITPDSVNTLGATAWNCFSSITNKNLLPAMCRN
jgi:type IV pilus assembly protein PilA